MKINEDFLLAVDDIFGILNCIKIVSNLENFKNWLKSEHKLKNVEGVFDGYKFFLESAIRTFLNTLIYNSSLGIDEDFVFYRARFVGVELNKIPNTCEKTILIKNINEKLKLIKKSKNYEELKSAIIQFNSILDIFKIIYDNNVEVNPKLNINKDLALKYLTMFYTYIYLNDTSRFIPHGYWVSILNNEIPPEKLKKNFKGYKYTLQFLWSVLLGEKYVSTSIANLHKADDWSSEDDFLFDLSRENKTITQREDLDSYFRKIRKEIIEPIEKELKINLNFTKILYLRNKILKKIFKDLLKQPKEPQLNEKEKLDYNLLWYQIEFLDSSKIRIFDGVPAFISLLVGTAELKRIFSENEKAYICKFIHPNKSVNGNDFSYGVLIEAFGSIGDYSGWILFFDCCGDYSGLSGSEHTMAEKFIEEYKKKGRIEVREMTISKDKLKEYIADKITSGKREEILQALKKEARIRQERDIISEAQGLVLELITYYTLSKKIYDLVDWNVNLNKDQLDIIVETKNEFKLIECKSTPNNININDEINKLRTKLKNCNTNKTKKGEFWFWIRPTENIIKKLNKEGISFVVVSELIDLDDIWKNKKKDKLKTIFNFNKKIMRN
ncbi:MAG: hypothetical protein QW244_03025 [Candidatus Pacearchaeota archaeon]